MALTNERVREILSSAGVDAEHVRDAANQIIEGHLTSINVMRDEITELKEQVNKYKTDAEKLPSVQTELDDLKAKVEADAKERKGKDYDALKKEYEDFKTEVERKATRAAKETAYKTILRDAGVPDKHHDTLLKYLDVDGVTLDDKGNITTAKDILKQIKEDFEPYIQKTQAQGAQTPTPPATGGGGMTREQIDAIEDTAERQRAIAEHHELFGF